MRVAEGKIMTKLNGSGPKDWSGDFYKGIISRKDDNHYPEVDQKMVDCWTENLTDLSNAVSLHFKSAIRVATVA
jgi:hypothetical protein